MKRLMLCVGFAISAALFTSNPASAVFGHRWHTRHSGCGGYGGAAAYRAPVGYAYSSSSRIGYSPYGYRSAYTYPSRSYYGTRNGYNSGYATGLYRSGYRDLYGSGYRGYGYPYSRYGSAAGLMGYGNGYYYGGFPASRASGIGLYPRIGYGW